MATDFVFPDNNEEKFLEIASKLGYNKLIFTYNYGESLGKIREKTKCLENKEVKVELALLSLPKNIRKAQKLAKYVLVQNSERFVFEKHKNLIVFNLEDSGKKDFIHHRSSGLNHVLCKLAEENNITVALSFNLILKADPMLRAKLLGRMEQNIKLCRKYNVKTLIASFAADPYEMRGYKDLNIFFSSFILK